jgi:LacI family transcriptional regulator
LYIPQWIDFETELGVAGYAREAGWILTSIAQHGGEIRNVLGQQQDGIITLLSFEDSEHADHVRATNLPVVDMDNDISAIRVPRVVPDYAAMGRMAADHLMDQGFRDLAFLTLSAVWNSVEWERGFVTAVAQRGRRCHALNVFKALGINPQKKFEESVAWIAGQLKGLPKPLGVMVPYDGTAPQIFQACKLAGLTIPNEVAVVGTGNNALVCELGELPLSSVDRNRRQHGYEAAALLDRLMAGEAPPPQPILIPPSHVVVRRSSDVLAVDNDEVRMALTFMREHYTNPDVGVEDVVRVAGTSRRRLYGLFDAYLGRGISETLTDLRIAEARLLLMETDMKIYAVAMRTGFSGYEHLTRSFKRVTGISPSIYRQQARSSVPPHPDRPHPS